MTLFAEMKKLILKSIRNYKKPQRAKLILKKKNKGGKLIYPDFKVYYKATVIKTMWCWDKDTHTDPYKRTESSETDPGTN